MKVGSYMKIKIKNLLLIMFTLSIMLLNAGNVMALETIKGTPDVETLVGGQTYRLKNEYMASYTCSKAEGTSNYIHIENTGSGCIIEVDPIYVASPINTSILFTVSVPGTPSYTTKKPLILQPNKRVKKNLTTTVDKYETLHNTRTTECSFSSTQQQKTHYYYSHYAREESAWLTFESGYCSFRAKLPGTYIVYSNNSGDRKSVV